LGGAELGILVKRREAGAEDHGSEAAGRKFGNYEVLEKIAQGGMGAVYKARQLNLDRLVALKLLPFGQFSRDDLLQRFRSEASAAAALQHPNIVAVHDVGEHDGQPFFSMDFVEGRTLAELVRDQPLPAKRAAAYLKTIAEAVYYAHQHGILHRDLKPSNILIDTSDQPRITDFGLAKRLGGDSDLTLTGQVLGSPNFISPEQAEGRSDAIGPPSDVYSLGALLYHLLTRQPPFQADTLTTLLKQVLEVEPIPPRSLNPSTPSDLETICLKCLEKEPARRYPTAQALADDLGRFLRAEPVRARPVGAVGKSWRWCRRQPVRAGLIAGLAVAVMLGIAGISWEWRRAERARRAALDNASLLRRQGYAADMNLVQRSLQDGDLGGARRLLNKYRPAAASPSTLSPELTTDLRGWEWRYLWGLSRSDDQGVLTQYSDVSNLALAPDSDLLAVHHGEGRIELWELATRQHTGTLTNRGSPLAMAFSSDGRLMACGNRDAKGKPVISIWVVKQKQIIRNILQPTNSEVISLAFSPDAKRLATFNRDPRLRLWDVESGKMTLDLPASEAINLSGRVPLFSPDGSILASGEMDGRIRLISLATGGIREIPAPAGRPETGALAFSPDGRLLATGHSASDGKIRLWDVATGNLAATLEGHRSGISKLVFAPDGRTLYSASADQTIRLWDLTRTKPSVRLQGHSGPLTGLVLSRDGRTLVSCATDGSVRLWDTRLESRQRSQVVLPEAAALFGALLTADNRCVITASPSNAVTIWDVATATAIKRIPALGTNNLSVALSPDQRLLAVGSADGILKIWDLKAQVMVTNWQPHTIPVYKLWFLEGGKSLFSLAMIVHERVEAKRWDAVSWRELPFKGWGTDPLYGFGLSPDQRFLAFPVAKGLKIWNCAGDRLEMLLPGARGMSAFSFDGRLVAADLDTGAGVWELASRRQLALLEVVPVQGVNSLAFSPDDKRLVTGLAAGGELQPGLRVWDYRIGRDLLGLYNEGYYIYWTEFSPDGNTLLGVSWYGVVNLYRAPSWAEIEAAEKGKAIP
jgi:serine/threonine protein kinase/dipeptidyl aminopeptidase/acylaminoacyl peptidase